MKLSVIVPTLDGTHRFRVPDDVPSGLEMELVVVNGVSPVGKARNEGLRRATGNYIAWIDADDDVTDDWLARIAAAMEEGVDCVVLDYADDNGTRWTWRETGKGILHDVILDSSLTCECWRFVTKRKLWEGLRFGESFRVAEDYRLIPEVISRVSTWRRAGVVYIYHWNGSSLIRNAGHMENVDRFVAGIERWERWRSTIWADAAFADAVHQAGWMNEWYGVKRETRAFLVRNFLRAMRCAELTAWWKLKTLILTLRCEWMLKPVYRLVKKKRT